LQASFPIADALSVLSLPHPNVWRVMQIKTLKADELTAGKTESTKTFGVGKVFGT